MSCGMEDAYPCSAVVTGAAAGSGGRSRSDTRRFGRGSMRRATAATWTASETSRTLLAGARRSAEAALHDRQLGHADQSVVVEVQSAAAAGGVFSEAGLGAADVRQAYDAVVVEVPVAVVRAPIVVLVADLACEVARQGDPREVEVERRAGAIRRER